MAERHAWEGWEEDVRRIIKEEATVEAAPEARAAADLTPVALGLGGFATTTFVLSIFNAGWLAQPTWLPLALFFGGLVQLLAGMWGFRDRDTFIAVVFSSYGGGFWLSLAFFFLLGPKFGLTTHLGPALGFFLLAWTIPTGYLWIASYKVTSVVFGIFTVFMITLLLLDVGFLAGEVTWLIVAGGYAGIALAASAWYFAAAIVINFTFGRTVLPFGEPLGG